MTQTQTQTQTTTQTGVTANPKEMFEVHIPSS
jgi:hypothetical protein